MREKRLHEENLEQNIASLENYLEGLKELEEVRLKKLRVLASLRKSKLSYCSYGKDPDARRLSDFEIENSVGQA